MKAPAKAKSTAATILQELNSLSKIITQERNVGPKMKKKSISVENKNIGKRIPRKICRKSMRVIMGRVQGRN